MLDEWYVAAPEPPVFAEDQRVRINSLWGAKQMSRGQSAIEQEIDDVYHEGKGWHWHFRKLLGEDVGDTRPGNQYDFDTHDADLEDKDIFNPEIKGVKLLDARARAVMFDLVADPVSCLWGRWRCFLQIEEEAVSFVYCTTSNCHSL